MNREKEIFNIASEMETPQERVAYLKGACGENASLREAVEELLAAHFEMDDFLPTMPGEVHALTEGEGSIIDRYKLLQKIGEGGFGIVYMAEQREPVRRRVALKIIRLGMNSKQVIARFEAERQALALMDHPNIARVLDGGTTNDGRPYFVMDLVNGLPITEYCNQQKLTARQRLKIFAAVCHAVRHAHQKGVIHRDLKPSNILVAPHDGRPVPMIIDFGIAKALQQPLTEHTLFTGFNQMVGTPAYMSPEQAEMNALDVDTRSDIYSLGAVLYELLTGSPPLNPRRLKEAAFGEMQRLIQEEEADKPSTRLRTLEQAERTAVAAQRQEDPRKLSRILSGELDWVVMKALEKDRNRRYDSAGALGDDIERYLAGDAVEACPPSALYQVQKFARKHRMPVIAVTLVMLALGLGAILSATQARRAAGAEREATDQLWSSYLVQARATRSAPNPGRQFASLDVIRKAAAIRPHINLRNEAIAAFALADMRPLHVEQAPEGRELYFDVARNRFAYQLDDSSIGIFQAGSQALLQRLPPLHGTLFHLRFSPKGRFLAMITTDPKRWLSVWDLAEENLLFRTAIATNLHRFSDDEKRFVCVRDDKSGIDIYSLETGEHTLHLPCDGRVHRAAFDPNSRRIAMVTDEGKLAIYEVDSGRMLHAIDHGVTLHALSWHPNGNEIATGDNQFAIQLWDLDSGEVKQELKGHESDVTLLRHHPNGHLLFSTGWDHTTRVWDLTRGETIVKTQGTMSSLSPDGSRLVISGGGLAIWEFSQGNPAIRSLRIPGGAQDKTPSLSFSHDDRWLATSRANVILWDLRQGRPQASMATDEPREVCFTGFGTDLFVCGRGGLQRLTLRSEMGGDGADHIVFKDGGSLFPKHVMRMGLAPNKELLAAITPGHVHLLDAASGKELRRMIGQPGITHGDVRFSPNGQWLVGTAWAGKGVRVWNLQSPDAEPVDLSRESYVIDACFSADGKWLITGTIQSYRYWRVGAWTESVGKRLPRSGWDLRGALAAHPNKPLIAVVQDGLHLQLRHVETQEVYVELIPPNPSAIMHVQFNDQGSKVAVITANQDLHIWDLPLIQQELNQLGLEWELE